jgi:hypothetical protein
MSKRTTPSVIVCLLLALSLAASADVLPPEPDDGLVLGTQLAFASASLVVAHLNWTHARAGQRSWAWSLVGLAAGTGALVSGAGCEDLPAGLAVAAGGLAVVASVARLPRRAATQDVSAGRVPPLRLAAGPHRIELRVAF